VNTEPSATLQAIEQKMDELRGQGLRLVFVTGNFNIVHSGHLRLLGYAKECGDYLVIGVLSDRLAGTSAHLSENARLEGVRANGWVDQAFVLDVPPEEAVRRLRPGVVVKGKEHEGYSNPEQAALALYGGQLLFSSGDTLFSSLDLLHKELVAAGPPPVDRPQDYLERHDISMDLLRKCVDRFSGLRVCVVGDLIVDEYIACDALGMSQEDASLVVAPVDRKMFVGGAGIVAAHAARLGATVDLVTVGHDDAAGGFAMGELSKHSVNVHIVGDTNRPTSLKQRFRVSGKTLLRVSHLRQHSVTPAVQDEMLESTLSLVDETDLLVFSDFNYGALPASLVDRIVETYSGHGTRMVADSQSSSQIGDIARFKRMSLITPTEREARLSTRDTESGLVVLAEKLRQQAEADNVLLTLGAEGLLVHAGTKGEAEWLTDRLPALNPSPRDVAGAGDSLIICASMALQAGANIWEAAYLGSLCAALQVGRIGNLPLSQVELYRQLNGTH
jgi:rfaE bifunctional protein kinase chain/domain